MSGQSKYKDTVNLPDTPFPMRGDLATREEAIKVAGHVAAEGQFAFLMIHSKDDLRPRKGPAAA